MYKIINDGETHLVIGFTIYCLCPSLSILYISFILSNWEDFNMSSMGHDNYFQKFLYLFSLKYNTNTTLYISTVFFLFFPIFLSSLLSLFFLSDHFPYDLTAMYTLWSSSLRSHRNLRSPLPLQSSSLKPQLLSANDPTLRWCRSMNDGVKDGAWVQIWREGRWRMVDGEKTRKRRRRRRNHIEQEKKEKGKKRNEYRENIHK